MERQAIKKRKLNGHVDVTDTQHNGGSTLTGWRNGRGDDEVSSKLHTLRSTGPSADDLLSAGAYKSPLVKLQIDELLKNVLLKRDARRQKIDEVLHKLKAIIESIPSRRNLPV